jgi:GNAT superfamily N-acetyltransferase
VADGTVAGQQGQQVGIRVADERDVAALARLRRAWLEERTGHPVEDPGFEAAFAQWWRVEMPRRTFWIAEVGTPRSGFTAVGSINVVEIVHMPRPGARGGRIGHVGNAFVLASFADRGVPGALLGAAIEHARDRRYRRLLLAPTAGSAAFYRRAGFAAAGEQLLMLDPATVPAPAS